MFSEESSDEEKIAATSRSRSRCRHAISAAAPSILTAARAPSPSGRSVARCIASTRACNQCQPGHSTAASAGGLDLGPANSKQHALPISSGSSQQCACVLSPGAGVGQKLPRRGRTSEKKPRLGQLRDGSASGKWLEVLLDITRRLGHESCTSLQRPLILHTMHTGIGSFRMFCDMAGIQVHDISGAERKPHAREFACLNRVAPRDLFLDTAEMLREARAVADPGYVRADIFHSGFPRQPFSKMSRRDRKPRDHPLRKEFEVVCAYINKTEPKA